MTSKQRLVACLLVWCVGASSAGCTSMKTIAPVTEPAAPAFGSVKASDVVAVQTRDGRRERFVVRQIVAACLVPTRAAVAQPRGEGVLAAGPIGDGRDWRGLVLGGGGEGRIGGRVGIGGEAGGLAPYAVYTAPFGKLHLHAGPSSKLVPFAAAGWAMAVEPSYGELYQGPTVGVGLTYWARPRTGVRIEYARMSLGRGGYSQAVHVVRAGVTFR